MTGIQRFKAAQPWLSLVMRVAMALTLIAAAIPKLQDLPATVRAVRAYRLLPEAVVPLAGNMLPIIELLLALVLIVGIFTRISAALWLAMMTAFTLGVVWVWAKGYSIDCGCFGGGGDVPEGATNYPVHLLERFGFIVMGASLLMFPRSKFSLDGWLEAKPEITAQTPEGS